LLLAATPIISAAAAAAAAATECNLNLLPLVLQPDLLTSCLSGLLPSYFLLKFSSRSSAAVSTAVVAIAAGSFVSAAACCRWQ
jgi:hypothetical protein